MPNDDDDGDDGDDNDDDGDDDDGDDCSARHGAPGGKFCRGFASRGSSGSGCPPLKK